MSAGPALETGSDRDLAEPLFQVIDVRRLEDGAIVVADGLQRIVVLDEFGSHVRTIGRRGSGPGEFQTIGWIEVRAPDSLFVYDEVLSRVSAFSLIGELIETTSPFLGSGKVEVFPDLHGRFADGSYLSSLRGLAPTPPGNTGLVRPMAVLRIADNRGLPGDSVAMVPLDEVAILQGVVSRPPFLRKTTIRVGPSEFYVAIGDESGVTAYRRDGKLETIFRTGRAPTPTPEPYVSSSRLSLVPGFDFPAAFPSVRTFLLDDLGYVWVEEFQAEERLLANWSVFTPRGHYIGDVLIDSKLRPLHIQSEWVTGVWTDSLGIETIRVYALNRSSE